MESSIIALCFASIFMIAVFPIMIIDFFGNRNFFLIFESDLPLSFAGFIFGFIIIVPFWLLFKSIPNNLKVNIKRKVIETNVLPVFFTKIFLALIILIFITILILIIFQSISII